MGSLQKTIAQALARLRDVTPSQKIALLLGGALVAVSLVLLAQWAASPELVPLLPQDLQPDEIALLRGGLEALDEPFDIRGSRVYVRSGANRQALLARLHQQEKLPTNTSAGFAALVAESDPWISQAENERRWIVALQTEIEQVLRQFQGVKNARIFLNLNTGRGRVTRSDPPKSASVTLVMKSDASVQRSLALAAARLVAGAVKGLSPKDVQVLDASGAPAVDWDVEHDATSRLARLLTQVERRYAEKIRRQTPDPKALISVHVELNSTSSSVQTDQPLKPVTLSEETETEVTTRIHRSEAPGVQPNVGVAVSAGGADESHEKERTKTESKPGMKREVTDTPAGDVQLVTAAISLSESYLESVFRHGKPDVETPTPEQIEATFQSERARLVKQIAKLVKPQDEANVAISRYYDGALALALAEPAGTLDQTLDLMRSYGPQSGLALLALLSLGLLLRLSRKSDDGESFGLELGLPEEAIEAAKQAAADVGTVATRPVRAARGSVGRAAARGGGGVPVVGSDGQVIESVSEAVVQQAAATEGMLVAQEVDAATVQTRKMLDQIVEMIDADPEVVAALVEQWIHKSQQYHEGTS